MKTLYLDLKMGVAGDMFSGALLQLFPENRRSELVHQLNHMGLQDVDVNINKTSKCGVNGIGLQVLISGEEELQGEVEATSEDHHKHGHEHDHHHQHDHHLEHEHHHHHHHGRNLAEVIEIIDRLSVSASVKSMAKDLYLRIAKAEGKAHEKEVGEVHFHEVGMKDAIFDVVSACVLMEELDVDRVAASPVCVGKGKVKCAHGILDVPAPATKFILEDEGVPYYYSEKEYGELCTPTGAAIVSCFVDEFLSKEEIEEALSKEGDMEDNKVRCYGYGMGHKDFDRPNCVSVMLLDSLEHIIELQCNIDDMTGEEVGFAIDRLMEAGARDAFSYGIMMKKKRPGVLLCVLCEKKNRNKMLETIFLHTSTIGVRELVAERYILEREITEKETEFGLVHTKLSKGFGIQKEKSEYEDVAKIARAHNMTLRQVRKEIE
ncbi:MAG: nickel pincer cofactor biosynthesis protein LarC [Lachnospiraceae bacterium]|nr:nickel pincer cofactor biosynthesis protein LarC [Lachnospiraceae bacterium]